MAKTFNISPDEAERTCQGGLPSLVIHGIEMFNKGDYFEAHEELELAWRAEREPVRELYRGILQIAVAYYHALRGNYPGAVKMFQRSRIWLGPFPDRCRGIDLAAFRVDYGLVEAELLRLGPDRLNQLDRCLMKPIHYTDQEKEA